MGCLVKAPDERSARGIAQRDQGELAAAESDFRRALECKAGYTEVYELRRERGADVLGLVISAKLSPQP